jgi:large subunit ribosomal protein L3
VIAADADRGVLMIKGSVPGSPGGYVLVKDAVKRKAAVELPFPAALREGASVESPQEAAP